MLVSDLVSQYQNSLGSGSKIATRTKGVEQLVKTASSLEKGQIFEGTVTKVKGDTVTLSLSSGQNITAKIDKNISMTEGQSVFFQVKSNTGDTIQIRPVSSEFGGNPTLLAALKNAGLKETESNLKMLNAMIREQMPIDKDSIQDMVRTIRQNPSANIDTLVSMKKLDMPINESMITQFENYKESEGAILNTVRELGEDIPATFSNEFVTKDDMIAFTKDFLTILGKDTTEVGSLLKGDNALSMPEGEKTLVSPDGKPQETSQGQSATGQPTVALDAKGNPITDQMPPAPGMAEPAVSQDVSNRSGQLKTEYPKGSIGEALSPELKNELSRTLNEIPGVRDSMPRLFDSFGNLRPDVDTGELIKSLNQYFNDNPGITKADMMKFFDSAPAKKIFDSLMGDAWTISPKELTKKHSVDKLYEKIEEDMEKIIQVAKRTTHGEANPISQSAQGIKDNLSFIREVNQLYQYVQIPLQMSGEKTTGELYVYANKKQKRAENDEITAFLHFDMENLGSTDISVKLANKKLDTRFFLEDDISFQIIEKNLPLLEERLKELGYDCNLTAENDSKKVNFVEDFLKQDSKSAGDIHRYSFDVRA